MPRRPRLTRRDRDGYAYCAGRDNASCDDYDDCFTCPIFDKMLQRLAEYEADEERAADAAKELKDGT